MNNACNHISHVIVLSYMQRTHVYLPDQLNTEIEFTARIQQKSKAEVIRTALERGLKTIRPKRSSSAKALLEMVKEAKKILKDEKLPKDLSINHDYYLWGGKKR